MYEVVKAETRKEALEDAKFKVGDVVRITKINAYANPFQGTWSVLISGVEKVKIGGTNANRTEQMPAGAEGVGLDDADQT